MKEDIRAPIETTVTEIASGNNIMVFTIVGMIAVGKTNLAHMIFNKEVMDANILIISRKYTMKWYHFHTVDFSTYMYIYLINICISFAKKNCILEILKIVITKL
jgi:deoxyadenosine/deoxycytidine kinase